MEKNPFVKNKKYNPDVLVNHGKKISERTNVEYKKKDEFFNSQINSTSLNVKLDKEMQTSDWGVESYSEAQIKYAASDVLYLHKIKVELDKILQRENKLDYPA